jgi:hypothetical protein
MLRVRRATSPCLHRVPRLHHLRCPRSLLPRRVRPQKRQRRRQMREL